MALEGLNTLGAYPVYDTSGTVNLYAKQMQQKQAQRQAEQKQLQDKLSKLNTEGLRPQDQDDYYKEFNNWKTLTQQAYEEKDPRKKFQLQTEAEKAYNGANQLVYESKEKTKRDAQIGMKILGKPHFFSKEGKTLYQQSLDAPVRSEKNIADYSTIPLGHDLDKVPDKLAKISDQVMQTNSRYDNDLGTSDGRGMLSFKKIKRGDPKAQALAILTAIDTQDDVEAYFEQQYPNLDWDNAKDAAKMEAVKDYITKNPLIKDEGVERRSDPNYLSPYQRERLAISRQNANGSGSASSGDVEDLPLYYGEGGQAKTTARSAVKLYVPTQNFQGSRAYDADQGKFVDLTDPSNKYSIVSVGNYPVLNRDVTITETKGSKKTTRKLEKGSIVQDGFAEKNPEAVTLEPKILVRDDVGGASGTLLLDYKYMPKTLTKTQREIAASFKPATGKTASQVQNSGTKTGNFTKQEKGSQKSGSVQGKKYAGLDKDGNPIFK